MVGVCSALWEITKLPSQLTVPLCSPTSSVWEFLLLPILASIHCYQCLDFNPCNMYEWYIIIIIIIIIYLLSFFRATPAAYGGSQDRCQIRNIAAGLCHSHSNAGSLTHWPRPGIKPASAWMLFRFICTEPWQEHLSFFNLKLPDDIWYCTSFHSLFSICICSLVKCLLKTWSIFKSGCLFSYCWILRILCIF